MENKIEFTKFLDVKSPIGFEQRNETKDNYSIGTDVYVPRFDNDFIHACLSLNNKLYEDLTFDLDTKEFQTSNYTVVARIFERKEEQAKLLNIYYPFTVPTGIGILLPQNKWCSLNSKSSNFNNKYTVVHGTIDMNYTYGCGVQIIPLPLPSGMVTTISEDQKFAQLIIHSANPIQKMIEIDSDEWNEMEEIQYLRGIRTGGFGSTGTHD